MFMKWKLDKLLSWENVNLMKCYDDKILSFRLWIGSLVNWLIDKMKSSANTMALEYFFKYLKLRSVAERFWPSCDDPELECVPACIVSKFRQVSAVSASKIFRSFLFQSNFRMPSYKFVEFWPFQCRPCSRAKSAARTFHAFWVCRCWAKERGKLFRHTW